MHESNTYLEDIQIKNTLFMYTLAGTRYKHTLRASRHARTWNKAVTDEGSKLNLVKEGFMFYGGAYTVTLQLNSKWINVCICLCVCMCVFGGPQGPVLMSYLCAFLTRARCSAHGTVILGRS